VKFLSSFFLYILIFTIKIVAKNFLKIDKNFHFFKKNFFDFLRLFKATFFCLSQN